MTLTTSDCQETSDDPNENERICPPESVEVHGMKLASGRRLPILDLATPISLAPPSHARQSIGSRGPGSGTSNARGQSPTGAESSPEDRARGPCLRQRQI